jgi:putative ATPase
MESLFANQEQEEQPQLRNAPLADRIRPRTIEDVIGQEHLLGESAPLRAFFSQGEFPSVILWGPPGVGKTTIALLIARHINHEFIRISAIEAGVKELREIIAKAERSLRHGNRTILFIDEIHRFNKSQQDALLHAVEKGIITLIGATTENPSFEVNSALLSRSRVYRLRSLDDSDIKRIIEHAVQNDTYLRTLNISIESWESLLSISGGDARTALNALELSVIFAQQANPTTNDIIITRELLENVLQQKTAQYDKHGESHYDTISAFIKSMRGSDPSAALFWLAKMIDAGEDARFIARRMVIFASEDVGNSDPQALQVAVSVFQAVEMVGMPEARINLAQGATYLASTTKSNASYRGIEDALSLIRSGIKNTVPLHLRNAPTKLMKQEGYAKEYKYPHSYPNHFVREHYFPSEIDQQTLYIPTSEGYEHKLRSRLESLWDEHSEKEG